MTQIHGGRCGSSPITGVAGPDPAKETNIECASDRTGSLQVLLLAGILALLSTATMAQQEVSPDIYGDTAPAAHKAKPVKQASKPSARGPKVKAESGASRQPGQPSAERKLAASARSKPIPATLPPGR